MKLLRTNSNKSVSTSSMAPPPLVSLLRNTSGSSTASDETLGSTVSSVLKKDTHKRRFRKHQNTTKPRKSVQFATDTLVQVHALSSDDHPDEIWWSPEEMAVIKEDRRKVVEYLQNRKECRSLLHKIFDNKGNVAKLVHKLHESFPDVRGLETVLASDEYNAHSTLHRFKVLEVAGEVYEYGGDVTSTANLERIRRTSLQSSAKFARFAKYF